MAGGTSGPSATFERTTPTSDRDPGVDAVLVYDPRMAFFDAAAVALNRLPRVGAIPDHDDAAWAFLAATFRTPPFALVLADVPRGPAYVGRDAARELAVRAGMVGLATALGVPDRSAGDRGPGPRAVPPSARRPLSVAAARARSTPDLRRSAEPR